MKKPRKIYLNKAADVPNSPLPVLLYRAVVPAGNRAEKFRRAFAKNGWAGIWTDTIYDYTHYHSNAHEALGVAEGKATVQLGGENGTRIRLRAGDLLVLPAGTGHKRLGDGAGLKVVGCYPKGQSHYTMKRPEKYRGGRQPRVKLPETDPFYGENGPLPVLWLY